LLWRGEGLGVGYASVVVSDGSVFTIGRRGKDVFCYCLEEKSGELRWSRRIGATSRIPCSTPTVDGDRVYALDPDGNLWCLNAATGEPRWTRSFLDDFGGVMMSGRGYGESPLIDRDRLICTPGGGPSTIVALNKMTGDTIWTAAVPELGQAGRPGAGFSSIVISRGGGVKQYVQLVGRGVVGVRASDGKFLWGHNAIANQTANIPTPVTSGDYVFSANGYNAGSVLLKLSKTAGGVGAEPVYELNGSRFQNHHGGVMLLDEYIFGGHGSNNGLPTCLEFATGKIKWKRRGPGVGSASIVYADGCIYFRYQDGRVALVAATPKSFQLRGSFQLPGAGGDSWSHPVVANGRLLLREKDRLFAYDVRSKSPSTVGVDAPSPDELIVASHMRKPGRRSILDYACSDAPSIRIVRLPNGAIQRDGRIDSGIEQRLSAIEQDVFLDLAGSSLGDDGLRQVAALANVRGLSLELCTSVTDAGIAHLRAAKRLRALQLTGVDVTANGLRSLSSLEQLVALDLEVCEQVADGACEVLAQMPQLRSLVLKKTAFERAKITEAGIAKVGELTNLEVLSLYGCGVNDESIQSLAGLTHLRRLDLSLTGVTDKGLPALAPLRRLERLDLLYSEGFAGPMITDGGISSIGKHTSLTSLNLVGAKLTDASIPQLEQLEQLRSLRVVNTQLTAQGVTALQKKLPDCQITR
jgi:outer membrane protein assembly factor BamB